MMMIATIATVEITSLSRNGQIIETAYPHILPVNTTIRAADVNAVTIFRIVNRSLNAGVTLTLTIHT
jgi:hypothetical protein